MIEMKKTLTTEEVNNWWYENMSSTLTAEQLDMLEMYMKDDDLYINVTLDDMTIEQFRNELEDWIATEVKQITE